MNLDATPYSISEQFQEEYEKNTKQKRKMSFWPKWKKKIKGWSLYKIFIIVSITLFGFPIVYEALWDLFVLKKADPLVIYRLGYGLFFILVMGSSWTLKSLSDLLSRLIDLANAQDAQITVLEKILKSKVKSDDISDIPMILSKKKKRTSGEGDLKN